MPEIFPTCPFCIRIEAKDYKYESGGLLHADGSGGWDDPNVVSFEPLNPVTPGHRLFLPTAHITRPWTMGSCAYGDIWAAAARYGSDLMLLTPERVSGFNLITSFGAAATQTVEHIHIHCVPRREDDDLHLPWTGQHE